MPLPINTTLADAAISSAKGQDNILLPDVCRTDDALLSSGRSIPLAIDHKHRDRQITNVQTECIGKAHPLPIGESYQWWA